jgi:hypothetical protein
MCTSFETGSIISPSAVIKAKVDKHSSLISQQSHKYQIWFSKGVSDSNLFKQTLLFANMHTGMQSEA